MIRAVIIDDEKNNIETMVSLLRKHELPVTVVGSATNADDAIYRRNARYDYAND